VRVHADKVADALPHVSKLVEESRKEEGVIKYEVFTDIKEAGTYIFIEKFASLAVVEKHQHSNHFKEAIENCKQWFLSPVELRVLKKAL
jgi:quinol monooxygenase YgiN